MRHAAGCPGCGRNTAFRSYLSKASDPTSLTEKFTSQSITHFFNVWRDHAIRHDADKNGFILLQGRKEFLNSVLHYLRNKPVRKIHHISGRICPQFFAHGFGIYSLKLTIKKLGPTVYTLISDVAN